MEHLRRNTEYCPLAGCRLPPAVAALPSLLQATPSQAELAFQQFKQRKQALEGVGKQDILAKYGNAAEKASDDVRALQVRLWWWVVVGVHRVGGGCCWCWCSWVGRAVGWEAGGARLLAGGGLSPAIAGTSASADVSSA